MWKMWLLSFTQCSLRPIFNSVYCKATSKRASVHFYLLGTWLLTLHIFIWARNAALQVIVGSARHILEFSCRSGVSTHAQLLVYHPVVEQEHTQLQTVDCPTITMCLVLPCQAAATLKELYKKHPVLYNSSVVCSFKPKVIYRVRGCWDWVGYAVFEYQTAVERNGKVNKCVNILTSLGSRLPMLPA